MDSVALTIGVHNHLSISGWAEVGGCRCRGGGSASSRGARRGAYARSSRWCSLSNRRDGSSTGELVDRQTVRSTTDLNVVSRASHRAVGTGSGSATGVEITSAVAFRCILDTEILVAVAERSASFQGHCVARGTLCGKCTTRGGLSVAIEVEVVANTFGVTRQRKLVRITVGVNREAIAISTGFARVSGTRLSATTVHSLLSIRRKSIRTPALASVL